MYQYPSTYACKKCGHEHDWTPSDFSATPVVSDDKGRRAPICPKCWNKWLNETFGPMEIKEAVSKQFKR